ncbi:phospholipase [Arsukibacterium indicum]|uniref:Phospholipase n=1 Tax=Arsukibacterium indicum TaxID=2848612 RepID=A0ABS6MKR3_9GAMM|nr:phospholipase [Arsukibacterium indicum]MBV2128822.1 phospholipase [Arsukibacterium indicum]
MSKDRQKSLVFSVLLTIFTAEALSVERITIVGQRPNDNGFSVLCSGSECSNLANSIAAAITEYQSQVDSIGDEQLIQEVQNTFCQTLRSREPQSCHQFRGNQYWPGDQTYSYIRNMHIPPISNGCGTGSIFESAAVTLLEVRGLDGFSGNVNSPRAGYDFTSACNNHDICYASGSSQRSCDDAFASNLLSACSGELRCGDFAGLYVSAVRVLGGPAKQNAVVQNTCRNFKDDFNANC